MLLSDGKAVVRRTNFAVTPHVFFGEFQNGFGSEVGKRKHLLLYNRPVLIFVIIHQSDGPQLNPLTFLKGSLDILNNLPGPPDSTIIPLKYKHSYGTPFTVLVQHKSIDFFKDRFIVLV